MKKSKKNNLLWQFTDPESGRTSYIFGTIHLRDERVYFRTKEVESLIEDCDVFMAEYPLDDAGDSTIMSALQFDNGKHLRNHIPNKKFDKLNEMLYKSFGIDLERLGFFKPMVIENMLTESIFDNDYEFPMDIILWNFAKENGKIVVGAETTKSQIDIMKKLSIKQQVKSLIDIGRNPKRYRKKIKKLIKLYENQNLRELYRQSVKSLGKMKDILVFKRNINIVESILQYSNNQKVFVAVGAGHLAGNKGILKLLKEKGYKVEAMRRSRARHGI